MAESSASSSSSDGKTGSAGLPLDVFGKLLDTVSAIAKHQALSQGTVNKEEVDTKSSDTKKSTPAMTPFDMLANLIQMGGGPALMQPPQASASAGGKSALEKITDLFSKTGGKSGASGGSPAGGESGASAFDQLSNVFSKGASAVSQGASAVGEGISSAASSVGEGISALLAML